MGIEETLANLVGGKSVAAIVDVRALGDYLRDEIGFNEFEVEYTNGEPKIRFSSIDGPTDDYNARLFSQAAVVSALIERSYRIMKEFTPKTTPEYQPKTDTTDPAVR